MLNKCVVPLFDDSEYLLSCLTFCAFRKSLDQCGSNGLPLTPNSIQILGRAQYLRALKHPNLCSYLDVIRGKYERTVVVSEYCGEPLSSHQLSYDGIISLSLDILTVLKFLHSNNIIHRNLSPENILIYKDRAKLFNYGLYYMTGNGKNVMFPIGNPKYLAPEILLSGPTYECSCKVDYWALGMILMELFLGVTLFSELSFRQTVQKIISLTQLNNIFCHISNEVGLLDLYKALPQEAIELVNNLLISDPLKRPSVEKLLNLGIYTSFTSRSGGDTDIQKKVLNTCSHFYHYWQLAGGDVFLELKKEGLIRSKPPILSLPNLIMLEGLIYGQKKDESVMLDARVVKLSIQNLKGRFSQLSYLCHFPLIEHMSDLLINEEKCDSSLLPIIIRERDTEYQFKRITLFISLLMSYPYKRDLLIKEARHDIPPIVRSDVWACLLNIDFNYVQKYRSIDKESPMFTDRQIEVDIPRCHQYNELLSSVDGHRKFKRILKAWVISHPQYVYWQGLDSLSAPFLYLNFHNEARAFACLCKFIYKYLHDFFLKDNSAVIREYLAKFRHLIAFQDPELANHLNDIGFTPELFAIPWYLTMFSHVFPIHKILHLWDSLLLGNASYPLYVGFAILQQLRTVLLSSGFNECILLFSDLPEIDIEKVVKESKTFYCSTPSSVTYRQHELSVSTLLQPLNSDMDMTGQPLSELQSELSPRICGRELIEILLNDSLKSKLVLLDVREPSLFDRYSIVGSINHPSSTLITSPDVQNNSKKSKLCDIPSVQNSKGKIVIVISDNMKTSSEVCNALVKMNIPKVCSLHGGIKSMMETKFIISNNEL